MRFQLLGPLMATEGDGPIAIGGPKQRLVLAHLLLNLNQTVPADHLIDAVWGEEPPETARGTLQTYVSRLRSALGSEAIEGRAPGYRIRAEPEELDTFRFETLLREARDDGLGPRESLDVLDEALGLWRGPALADLALEPSLLGEIARLEELRLSAIEERIASRLDLGQHAEVVAEIEAATAAHPLRERLWGQLILALYRSGRQAEALVAFERARELLANELGIDPSRELQDLHARVLQQDETLQLPGEALRGYRLLNRIGEGAFGSVFRAIQPQVEREVAIKAIHAELANQPDFVRRFEREAQLVARLEHPHIVPLYDYWREPDAAYLIMRFLRGGSLEDELRDGPLELERAAQILDQIGAGLAAAHHQGVVHRDVKPGNVLLDEEGNAYLSDFGIALETGAPEQTAGTMIRGTPAYLSPEQIKLEQTSPRSDIYALGVVLYEMLTSEHPFPGTSLNVLLDQHLHHPIPSVREKRTTVPPGVDAAIARATAKDPQARFADVLELCAAYRGAVEGTSARVRIPGELRNPYKGLRAFLEADSADFFGRELLTRRLVERVAETGAPRFLCVVGPSGSGKSSVVRAGLVPAIRRGAIPGSDRWYVADLLPGAHPMRELERALLGVGVDPPPSLLDDLERDELGLTRAVDRLLPDPDAELIIVLDQLEELFTIVESDAERVHVLESLRVAASDPASRVRVVATLRADFFDQPLSIRGFGDLLAARNEAITPMSPEELERAIVGPAERVGLDIEPGLVAAMVADVIDRPGALPLLQYALTELADREDVGSLTLSAYRRIGGVSGALARRAEHLFDGLDDTGREACRQLFLRLVTLGEGSDDTRRRVRRSELTSSDPEATDPVIDAFGRHRLLSFDRDPSSREPTVEIAHEALLRAWGRLPAWIDAAREHVRQARALDGAAADWRASDRDPSFLLQGNRLLQAEEWARDTDLALGATDHEYLDASVERRDAEQDQERRREERERHVERRSRSRLRILVAVLTVAAVVASTLTVVAVGQRREASEQTRVAIARELAAAAVANLDVDAERSILLAMEAVDTTRLVDGSVLPEAEGSLHRAIGASRVEMSLPGKGGDLDWSSKGVFVTTGRFAGESTREIGVIDIRGAESGEIVLSFPGDNQGFRDVDVSAEVAFSADSSMLATLGNDDALKVFDPATGVLVSSVSGSDLTDDGPFGPSLTSDGSLAAAVWDLVGDRGSTARVVDLSTQRVLTFPAPGDANATAFSPDGTQIALAAGTSAEPVVWVTDIATGDIRELTKPGPFGMTSVAWSPDGRYIAAGGWDADVPVWDARGKLRFLLKGHTNSAHWLDWSPDSSALVTGSDDGTAKVWEITEHGASELMTLAPQEGTISGVAFSGDGTQVMVGSETSAVEVWDVGPTGDAEWANVPNDGDVLFARSGSELITSSIVDGTVTVLDIDTGQQSPIGSMRPYGRSPAVYHDLSPDGASTAIRYGYPLHQKLSVRDVATGNELFAVDADVWFVDWSPSGEYVAVDSRGSVSIYDLSGHEVEVLPGAGGQFGPHGLIATFGGNNPIEVWDWRREEVIATLPIVKVERVAFDPSGEQIATDELEIWDVASEEVSLRLPHSVPEVTALAFSPDGTRLAVGSLAEVRVFDAGSGAELLVLRGHRGSVDKVVFSPDGSMLASWADDGTRVWALDIDDLIEIARSEVTRGLTEAECRQYLHVRGCPSSSSSSS